MVMVERKKCNKTEGDAGMKLKKILILIPLFLLKSCAVLGKSNDPAKKTDQLITTNIRQISNDGNVSGPKEMLEWSSGKNINQFTLRPGMATLLEFDWDNSQVISELVCNDKRIPHFTHGKKIKAYIAESYFSSLMPYQCFFKLKDDTSDSKKIPIAKIQVIPYEFPQEKIGVDKNRVFLSKKNLKRVRKESSLLSAIYQNSSSGKLFMESFEPPLNSYITSHYGTKRIYNKMKKSQHLGTDFRAKVGIPIKNSNSGKVVYAGGLFYTGKTIIIDHGLGIFTVYAHLSKILVKINQIIPKNYTLGLTGSTGRVSGPHLHWGVKIHDHWVDGFSLVNSGI